MPETREGVINQATIAEVGGNDDVRIYCPSNPSAWEYLVYLSTPGTQYAEALCQAINKASAEQSVLAAAAERMRIAEQIEQLCQQDKLMNTVAKRSVMKIARKLRGSK